MARDTRSPEGADRPDDVRGNSRRRTGPDDGNEIAEDQWYSPMSKLTYSARSSCSGLSKRHSSRPVDIKPASEGVITTPDNRQCAIFRVVSRVDESSQSLPVSHHREFRAWKWQMCRNTSRISICSLAVQG